jgi:ribosomal protein L37AE/L43A
MKVDKPVMGPVGFRVGPKCGEKVPHQAGMPRKEEKCPKCGTRIVREGFYHLN